MKLCDNLKRVIIICEHRELSDTISEYKVTSPPSQQDIAEVRDLLKEFGLKNIDFPRFKTYGELHRWKLKQILNCEED